jgi:uncharacterized protein YkwD
MSRTRSTVRRRGCVAIIAAAVCLSALAPAPVAIAGAPRKMLQMVNESRARHDLRPLKLDRSLHPPSRRHTNRMIREDRIFDPPNLAEILSGYAYDDLGADVVGCANTLRELHRALMAERWHRAILLHADLRRIGIGVIVNDRENQCGRGSYWATEIFYG